MKLFFDLLPIILFFIAYKLGGIYIATATAIVTVVGQIGGMLLKGKKPEMMHYVTLAMILILGGATLVFHNEMFIKWKPTVVYWILGIIFWANQFFSPKSLVERMLEKNLELPAPAWAILNTSWIVFFLVMGILNIIVVYNFNTDVWVNFKLFGTLALTLVFVVVQGLIVSRYLPTKQD